MGEVIILDLLTKLELPVYRVIEALKDKNYSEIVVIGYNKEEDEISLASTLNTGGRILWLLERGKQILME